MFKVLGLTPKYWVMDLLGLFAMGCGGGGGGTSVNVDALRDQANMSIDDIMQQQDAIQAFAGAESTFVDTIQQLDESLVHKGASTDIEDLTEVAIQTDIATGFEGSGEIANIKEDTTKDIYDTVSQQYSTIDIGADREKSQIQFTADSAIAQLENQINQIITMFIGTTGQPWDTTVGSGSSLIPPNTGASFLEGDEFQAWSNQMYGPNPSNPYELSDHMSNQLSSYISNYTQSSGMQMSEMYRNPLATAGLFDDNELMSSFFGSSAPGDVGLVNWNPNAGYTGLNQGYMMGQAGFNDFQNWASGNFTSISDELAFGQFMGPGYFGGGTQGPSMWDTLYNNPSYYMNQNVGPTSGQGYGQYSDRRLKHNIELVGKSPKGYNIYEFEYLDNYYGPDRYRGVMSDEVPFAAIEDSDGFEFVNYNHPDLDVEFERVDNV
jgi:hypothetical protein